MIIGYSWTTATIFPHDSIQNSEHVKTVVRSSPAKDTTAANVDNTDDEEKPDPRRNFTLEQLIQFDGTNDVKSGEPKPVYLSVDGMVFDVSQGRGFYGPGGPYEKVWQIYCDVRFYAVNSN
jgi:hypothetical protein